jgi:hypothetical protein
MTSCRSGVVPQDGCCESRRCDRATRWACVGAAWSRTSPRQCAARQMPDGPGATAEALERRHEACDAT